MDERLNSNSLWSNHSFPLGRVSFAFKIIHFTKKKIKYFIFHKAFRWLVKRIQNKRLKNKTKQNVKRCFKKWQHISTRGHWCTARTISELWGWFNSKEASFLKQNNLNRHQAKKQPIRWPLVRGKGWGRRAYFQSWGAALKIESQRNFYLKDLKTLWPY